VPSWLNVRPLLAHVLINELNEAALPLPSEILAVSSLTLAQQLLKPNR
jgi:hypothetical protein